MASLYDFTDADEYLKDLKPFADGGMEEIDNTIDALSEISTSLLIKKIKTKTMNLYLFKEDKIILGALLFSIAHPKNIYFWVKHPKTGKYIYVKNTDGYPIVELSKVLGGRRRSTKRSNKRRSRKHRR